MRRPAAALLLLALCAAAAPAAAQTWQLFASGSSARVFFDRDSVREADGYVHFQKIGVRARFFAERNIGL